MLPRFLRYIKKRRKQLNLLFWRSLFVRSRTLSPYQYLYQRTKVFFFILFFGDMWSYFYMECTLEWTSCLYLCILTKRVGSKPWTEHTFTSFISWFLMEVRHGGKSLSFQSYYQLFWVILRYSFPFTKNVKPKIF